jgi:hypothetical protein
MFWILFCIGLTSAQTVLFTKSPNDTLVKDQGSVTLIWDYVLQDNSTRVILVEFTVIDQDGVRATILSVGRNGIPTPAPRYAGSVSFEPCATLILDPVKTSDEGNIS